MQLSLFQSTIPSLSGNTIDDHYRKTLTGHIPDAALPSLIPWLTDHPVLLKLTRSRKSKSGDFRPSFKHRPAMITVNRSLNCYAFLITLVHEMAHYEVFTRFQKRLIPLKRGKRIAPHGSEWKTRFQQLMAPFLTPAVFPSGILQPLVFHMQNPSASTFSDVGLTRVLMEYDKHADGIPIENIPDGTYFYTARGVRFQKEKKLRKRFRCIRLSDHRIYLFSPLVLVFPREE